MADGEKTQEIMPGLKLIGDTEAEWRIEADNVDVLRKVFGDELLIGFCQCFSMLDRILSVYDCMGLNYAHVKEDSIRQNRNHFTLATLLSAYAHELTAPIQTLSAAGIESRLSGSGKQRWQELLRFARLEHGKMTREVRHSLAFQPGLPDVVRAGLKVRSARADALRLISSEGPPMVEARHDFGTDVTIAGMQGDTPDEDFRAQFSSSAGEAKQLVDTLMSRLEEVFFDVLRQAGANLKALPPLEGGLPAARARPFPRGMADYRCTVAAALGALLGLVATLLT